MIRGEDADHDPPRIESTEMMTGDQHHTFGPFEGRIWLNTAHQGPLPRSAVEAARQAIALKVAPARLAGHLFDDVPRRLRAALGALLGAPPDEIVLGNSASHGLQQIVLGYPWRAGDEVLLVRGDFPATTIPWLLLEDRGVRVRWLDAGEVPTPERLDAAIGPFTRLFCTTWVHSFLGHALDLEALGRVCAASDVWFVVNASQGLGALPLDVGALPVDAVTACGHKFLCGPYGTGVCWIRPELFLRFRQTQAYWLRHVDLAALEGPWRERLRSDHRPADLDMFGTANFFNAMTWTAALEHLLRVGSAAIVEHDQRLVSRLIAGLADLPVRIVSPLAPEARSAIVVIDQPNAPDAAAVLRQEGIDVAVRQGRLRISPHLHNTDDDIDRLIGSLARWLSTR